MKRQIIFSAIILLVALMTTVSCKKQHTPKTVDLNNMSDSINYAIGHANGAQIRNLYLNSLENEKEKNATIRAFIDALDKAFNSNADPDEIFQMGMQIGGWLRQMEKEGLLGEENLKSNSRLVKQGLRDGVNGTTDWSPEDAQNFIQMVMTQIQEERMRASFDFDMNDFFIEEDIIEID